MSATVSSLGLVQQLLTGFIRRFKQSGNVRDVLMDLKGMTVRDKHMEKGESKSTP